MQISCVVSAEEKTFIADNRNLWNYEVFYASYDDEKPWSFFGTEDAGFYRVDARYEDILVEHYNTNYQFISNKYIKYELPKFGGFLAGKDAFYLVFGQNNKEESNAAEVIRIVKYDKQWNRLMSASIYGANTTIPFDAGVARMAEDADTLYLHTCHEMYTSSDGKRHQSNMTVLINKSDMTVERTYDKVGHATYVSHSFNQFIMVDDQGHPVTLDHGDGFPRSAFIQQYDKKDRETLEIEINGEIIDTIVLSEGTCLDPLRSASVLKFTGKIGENRTGATLGGLEYSSTHYLTVGGSDRQNRKDGMPGHNIYVTATDRTNISEEGTQFHWITAYGKDSGIAIYNPQLAKLNDDSFLLLWNELDDPDSDEESYHLRYVFLNSKGEMQGNIYTASGCISDCQPIAWNGKIYWYVTDNVSMKICTIDASGKYEEHKVAYPDTMDIYPKSVEECDVFCNIIGMGNMVKDFEDDSEIFKYKYFNVMLQDRILKGNKEYEIKGKSGIKHVSTEAYYRINFEVHGITPYCYGKMQINMNTIRKIPVITSVKHTAKGNKIVWEEESGAAGYVLYRSIDNKKLEKVKQISDSKTTSWIDKMGKKYTGKYRYYLKAYTYNSNGKLIYTKKSKAKILYPLDKPKPKHLKSKRGKISLKWKSVKGAKKYQIQVSRKYEFKSKKIYWTKKKKYTVKKLRSHEIYYVRIRANKTYKAYDGKKRRGYSAWSKVLRVYVK